MAHIYPTLVSITYLHTILDLSNADLSTLKLKQRDPVNKPTNSSKEEEIDANVVHDSLQKELNGYSPLLFIEWAKEGITNRTRDKFDIRYDYNGERVVIPIRNHTTGLLSALSYRTIKTAEECKLFNFPKYVITKGYNKHKNIFGLYENREAIQKAGYVVVYEAEKSVFKRDTLMDSTGVALSGHTFSDNKRKF